MRWEHRDEINRFVDEISQFAAKHQDQTILILIRDLNYMICRLSKTDNASVELQFDGGAINKL